MSLDKTVGFFLERSVQCNSSAMHCLETYYTLLDLPYYSSLYQARSCTYPLWHLTKMVTGAGRILYGLGLLLMSLVIDPNVNLPQVALGLVIESATFLLNLVNVFMAVGAWFTRSMLTWCKGYEETRVPDWDLYSYVYFYLPPATLLADESFACHVMSL